MGMNAKICTLNLYEMVTKETHKQMERHVLFMAQKIHIARRLVLS
jgi:hypothetical protein